MPSSSIKEADFYRPLKHIFNEDDVQEGLYYLQPLHPIRRSLHRPRLLVAAAMTVHDYEPNNSGWGRKIAINSSEEADAFFYPFPTDSEPVLEPVVWCKEKTRLKNPSAH